MIDPKAGTLQGGSDHVLHYNPDSGEWSEWHRDANNGEGGWEEIDASEAKEIVGEDLDPEEAKQIFGGN